MSDNKLTDKKSPEQSSEDQPDWIDELYAEGQQELPPPMLDARIQAAARAPVSRPWYFSPGRLTTLATAASLVLAAMVIYYLPDVPPAPASEGLMLPEALEEAEQQGNVATLPGGSDAPARSKAFSESVAAQGEPPAAAGKRGAAESAVPAAAPMEFKKAERYQALTDELAVMRTEQRRQNPATDSAGVAMASMDMDSAVRLAELCGPLPGTAETRALHMDSVDWYLTVTGPGADRRYWRCQDGAWIELAEPVFDTPSEEQ